MDSFLISLENLIIVIAMTLLFFLIFWFICFEQEDEHDGSTTYPREHFEIEADCLMGQFGINSDICYDEALAALWNIFIDETSLLADDGSLFALCKNKDPDRRTAWFFSKVERGIDEVFSMGMCDREDTGLLYLDKLCQMSQMQSKPTHIKKQTMHTDTSESKHNVSYAEDIMEHVVTKGEIISNIEGKSKLNDDNGT